MAWTRILKPWCDKPMKPCTAPKGPGNGMHSTPEPILALSFLSPDTSKPRQNKVFHPDRDGHEPPVTYTRVSVNMRLCQVFMFSQTSPFSPNTATFPSTQTPPLSLHSYHGQQFWFSWLTRLDPPYFDLSDQSPWSVLQRLQR